MRLCLVFDLDGTLYPEREYALSGFRAAGLWAESQLGLTSLAERMTELLDKGHRGNIFDLVLAERLPGHEPGLVQKLVDAYRTHEPQIALFEDARWALEYFGARLPLALVTDGYLRSQQRKVRALGIANRFREIVYTDSLGGREFWKPDPKAFATIATALGSEADAFAYVGDDPAKDFVAPNRMGWLTVQVLRPGGIHDGAVVAKGGAPQHVISGLAELATVLGCETMDRGNVTGMSLR